MAVDPDSLFRLLKDRRRLPPVHTWQPKNVQDIGMRIARDGTWYYCGSPITRQRMVALFSTILRRDADGHYLVTPVEKVPVEVERAPFIAVQVEFSMSPEGSDLAFRTNVDDIVVADADHPLWVEQGHKGPLPFIEVRDGLNALLTRSVFYELAESATPRVIDGREMLGVSSRGEFFILGPAHD